MDLLYNYNSSNIRTYIEKLFFFCTYRFNKINHCVGIGYHTIPSSSKSVDCIIFILYIQNITKILTKLEEF